MANTQFYIISNLNDITANNAYNELSKYNKINRLNDIIAYKQLVGNIRDCIKNIEKLNSNTHSELANTILGTSYDNVTPDNFLGAYAEVFADKNENVLNSMLEEGYTANVNTDKWASIFNSATVKYDQTVIDKLNVILETIDKTINDLYNEYKTNSEKVAELKQTISKALPNCTDEIAEKCNDYNELQPKYVSDDKSLKKIYNKLLGVFTNVIETSDNEQTPASYIINVGGLSADVVALNRLVNEINALYAQLYDLSTYDSAIDYIDNLREFINNYVADDNKLETIFGYIDDNYMNHAQSVFTEYTLDNSYIYTNEDRQHVEELWNAQKAAKANAEANNEVIQQQIDNKLAEYATALTNYAESHNGEEYTGNTINNIPGKSLTPQDDKTNNVEAIITHKIINITGIVATPSTITTTVGESAVINLSYRPNNYTQVINVNDIQVDFSAGHYDRAINKITIYPESVVQNGVITISLGDVSTTVNITVNEAETPIEDDDKYYFGTFKDKSVIVNDTFNFAGLEKYTEEEYFNEERDGYKYHAVDYSDEYWASDSDYYVLIPNKYLNKVSLILPAFNENFTVYEGWTDNNYILLNIGSVVANFEIRLTGQVVFSEEQNDPYIQYQVNTYDPNQQGGGDAEAKTDPILTVNNPESTTIADGGNTTITVTSNVAGLLRFSSNNLTAAGSDNTVWKASITPTSTASKSFTITITNNTAVSEQSAIAANGIKVNFTPSDTTNYNTLSDVNAINQAITLSAADTQATHYYAGVTDKTSFTLEDLNQTGIKPITLSFDAATAGSDDFQMFVFPLEWGMPTAMMAGGLDGKGGWTWGDTYVTIPEGYIAASHQGGSVTYDVTWN